jgi:hypothetical protein
MTFSESWKFIWQPNVSMKNVFARSESTTKYLVNLGFSIPRRIEHKRQATFSHLALHSAAR